jgi:hypothetical protein
MRGTWAVENCPSANRLHVVRTNFHKRRSALRLNLSCLAESAANLRTSWVSSASGIWPANCNCSRDVLAPVEAVCDPIWF